MTKNGYNGDYVAEPLGEGDSRLRKPIFHPTDSYKILINKAKKKFDDKNKLLIYLPGRTLR